MKRTGALICGIALMLVLAACGGGTDERQTLIDELRADAVQSGATQTQINCVIDAMAALDAEQLQSIKDGMPNAQTQQVMTTASATCLPNP